MPHPGDDPALVPPITGGDAVESWFAAGYYRAWTCDAAPRASESPSPHGTVRACANAIAESDAADTVDTAVVIELAGGFASMRHTRDGDDGDSWYWYLRDVSGVGADGWGLGDVPAATYCAACHRLAAQNRPKLAFVFVVP